MPTKGRDIYWLWNLTTVPSPYCLFWYSDQQANCSGDSVVGNTQKKVSCSWNLWDAVVLWWQTIGQNLIFVLVVCQAAHSARPSMWDSPGRPWWGSEASLEHHCFPSQYCCVITLYLHFYCLPFNPLVSPVQSQFIASLVAGGVYMFFKLKSHQEWNYHFLPIVTWQSILFYQ